MELSESSRQRVISAAAIVLALLGLLAIFLKRGQILQALSAADWRLVPVALLFAALSYSFMSYGFVVVNRLFGILMRRRELFAIGFVSQVLNHVLSSGGAAGYSLRFLLIQKQGYAIRDIVAASLVHFYVTSLGMLALLPFGLFYLFLRRPAAQATTTAIGIAGLLVVAAFIFATVLVFGRSVRQRVLRLASRLWNRVTHRHIEEPLSNFDSAMSRGVAAFRRHPDQLAVLALMVTADWSFSLVTLWFCFDALGEPLKLGVLITGFSIGITAGVLSMVPGGLGVQEGSMAGIYTLLGVPLEQAVLAAILFRVVYYFIPYLVSLVFYRRLLRGSS